MTEMWKYLLIMCMLLHLKSGFILRLRTADHKRGACLADEQYYAIAPIQTLSNIPTPSNANGWLASVNESIDEFYCSPNVRCKNWITNLGAARVSSFDSTDAERIGFLKTRGWHYLPEYITDGSDFISPAINISQSVKNWRMSFLAEDKFEILLTGHEEWQGKPGVVIHLGPSGNWIAWCLKITKIASNSSCTEPAPFSPILTKFLAGRWVHLQLKIIEAITGNLTIELNFDGLSAKIPLKTNKLEVKYATFRSHNKPSVIKLHKFNVTYLAQKMNYDFQFTPRSSSNQVAFAFLFVPRTDSRIDFEKIEIEGSLLDKSKIVDSLNYTEGSQTFFTNSIANVTASKQIKISLSLNGNAILVSFGLLLKEPYAYYIDGNLTACQVLGTDQVTSTSRTGIKAVLKDLPVKSVCKKLKASNCKGVEACSPAGCYCFSGHTNNASTDNQCRDACIYPQFGPHCVQKIVNECKENKYDIHTGCSECQKPFRPPDCFEAISVFKHTPEIVYKGTYSVNVSAENAIKNLNRNVKSHFVRGELQLLQQTKVQKSFKITSLDATTHTFTQLLNDVEYTVRLVFFEANDLNDVERSPNATFRTKKCLVLNKNDLKIFLENEQITIKNQNPDICRIGQYKIYQDEKEILSQGNFGVAKSLKGFPKYSDYTVKFFANRYEIEGVKLHFKIPREEKIILKEIPVLLGITETSVKVSLKEELDTLSKEELKHFFKYAQIVITNERTMKEVRKNITNLSSAFEEILVENLDSSIEYKLFAGIIDTERNTTVDHTEFVFFTTNKCTPPSTENIKFINTENEISITFIQHGMHICNFSLQLKTPKGNEAVFWNRLRYKYFLTQRLPSDAEALIIEHASGERIEYIILKPSEFPTELLVTILVVLIILTVAVILLWRFKIYRRLNLQNCKSNGSKSNDLDLVPLSETPARTLEYDDFQKSSLISVRNFEAYLERARELDLFNKQHGTFSRGQTQPWIEGFKDENKSKNRYNNLAAYDATRVHLPLFPGDGNKTDYINANYVDGYKRPNSYIATQGPKPLTVADFWRMIWHEKVTLIVMVANVTENGKKKCEQYWPEYSKSCEYEQVRVQNQIEDIFADFVVRSFKISSESTSRIVTHLHYTSWPDHGVPQYPQSLANFSKKIFENNSNAPITVHCSAGVGRTGTIILIDACLRMALDEGSLDPFKLLESMRNQRANLVDNAQQYEFVHLVLLEILVVPKFSVSCGEFPSSLNILMAQNKKQFKNQYAQIQSVTDKDWKRAQAGEDTSDGYQQIECRNREMVSAFSSTVRLFPEAVTNQKMLSMNAVYIDGFRRKKQFIVAETPNPQTVGLFWCMIKQNQIEQVIILNDPGINEGIFVPDQGEKLIYNGFSIAFLREYYLKNCKIISCGVENGRDRKMVNVVMLTGWPARQSLGSSIDSLVDLWEETEKARAEGLSMIACYDGATACGLFLAMGFVLEKIKLEKIVDVSLAVRTLRQIRPSFIIDMDQFEAIYNSALTYLQAYDTYGNFQ